MAKDILHVTVTHYTRTNYTLYQLKKLQIYHTYGVNRLSGKSTYFHDYNSNQRIRILTGCQLADYDSADMRVTNKPLF